MSIYGMLPSDSDSEKPPRRDPNRRSSFSNTTLLPKLYQLLLTQHHPAGILNLTNLLRLLWLFLILYCERYIWSSTISACSWENWEHWPPGATPYRAALIADPQLVDIHTYSRRGWFLSSTIFYSDLYLRRSWLSMHDQLAPSEVVFLGDLFDGGREWEAKVSVAMGENTTKTGRDPKRKKDWDRYGEGYWMQELERFRRIFTPVKGVRIKTGLPGNHDLGFGKGVKLGARRRFESHFGPSNERWVAGNHTFISIDGVSLSNLDDPEIYGPSRDFLEGLSTPLKKPLLLQNASIDTPNPVSPAAGPPGTQQATILLTHVPLYRLPRTPCGPRREKRNGTDTGIPIYLGYQYQNVLLPNLSKELLDKVKPSYIFAGDDHDACEYTHPGGVKEWTVKSISWNMGVRRPGFEMISLWNPGNGPGVELGDAQGGGAYVKETVQAHLCLLPDQIAVFIYYSLAMVVTIGVVAVGVLRGVDRDGKGITQGMVLPIYSPVAGSSDEEEDPCNKYWKPAKVSRMTRGRFCKETAKEVGRVTWVVVVVYGVVLWRW